MSLAYFLLGLLNFVAEMAEVSYDLVVFTRQYIFPAVIAVIVAVEVAVEYVVDQTTTQEMTLVFT